MSDSDQDYQQHEEEDEEEELEEEEPPPKRQKLSKKNEEEGSDEEMDVENYLELSASVSEDDEEEDENEEVEFPEDDIVDDEVEEEEVGRGRGAGIEHIRVNNQREEQSVQEFVRQINERHRNYVDDTDEVEVAPNMAQLARQPTAKDRLWLVRCKPGKEREIVTSLLKKKEREDKPMPIFSVIIVDHLKGYFYVEAEKESHVRDVISYIDGVFQSKIQLIPIKEMVSVLTVPKKKKNLQKGGWVRIKRGTYRGDIAQVLEYDDSQKTIKVKIIPRLDIDAWVKKQLKKDQKDDDKPKVGTKRKRVTKDVPEARFFNAEDVRKLVKAYDAVAVELIKDKVTKEFYEKFDNQLFKDGFLIKRMSIKNVYIEGHKPSLEEWKKFNEQKDEVSKRVAVDQNRQISAMQSNRQISFQKGDRVIVTGGDLKNLVGVVLSIDGDKVRVIPKHKDISLPLEVQRSHLQKHFRVGDHVKVLSGQFNNETGLIVKIADNVAVIISDISQREIKVLTSDIRECTEVSTGVKFGAYSFHDLIELDQQNVGVILRIESDSAEILDMNDQVKKIKMQSIKRKLYPKNAFTRDAEGNGVGSGDQVQVIRGKYENEKGVVKHVHKAAVFVFTQGRQQNGGLYVAKGRDVKLLGISANKQRGQGGKQQNNYTVRGPAGRNRKPRNDQYLNKTVSITKGPWKGYLGLVKDTSDTHATVQLQTNAKRISIPKVNLKYLEERTKEPETIDQPDFDPTRTPLRPVTPRRPTTPSHDSNPFNPLAPQTPLRSPSGWDDDEPEPAEQPMDHMMSPMPESYPKTPVTPGTSLYDNTSTYTEMQTPLTPLSPAEPSMPNIPHTPRTPAVDSFMPTTPHTPLTPGGDWLAQTPPTPRTPGWELFNMQAPGTPSAVNTPAADTETDNQEESNWWLPQLHVQFDESFQSGRLQNKTGVISEVSGDVCVVTINGENEKITVNGNFLAPVKLEKKDRVKVTKGEWRNHCGTLIGIDNIDGIVKMDNLEIKIIKMNSLAKMAA